MSVVGLSPKPILAAAEFRVPCAAPFHFMTHLWEKLHFYLFFPFPSLILISKEVKQLGLLPFKPQICFLHFSENFSILSVGFSTLTAHSALAYRKKPPQIIIEHEKQHLLISASCSPKKKRKKKGINKQELLLLPSHSVHVSSVWIVKFLNCFILFTILCLKNIANDNIKNV